MKISDRLKEAREAKNKTRRDLATAVGVSSAAISQWESGETKSIAAENLLRTAKFLNVRPDWLVFGTGTMDSPSAPAEDLNSELMKKIIFYLKGKRSDLPAFDFAELCIAIYEYLQDEETPEEQQTAKIISLTKIFGKTT